MLHAARLFFSIYQLYIHICHVQSRSWLTLTCRCAHENFPHHMAWVGVDGTRVLGSTHRRDYGVACARENIKKNLLFSEYHCCLSHRGLPRSSFFIFLLLFLFFSLPLLFLLLFVFKPVCGRRLSPTPITLRSKAKPAKGTRRESNAVYQRRTLLHVPTAHASLSPWCLST